MSVLQWISGSGWLVFASGANDNGVIRAQALSRIDADGAMACISLAEDGGDSLLDDLTDLGAPSGYVVDIVHEAGPVVRQQLKDSSIIAIEIGTSLDALYNAMTEDVLAGMKEAYENGAVILVEGLAMNLFGQWLVSDNGDILDGLAWVTNAFLEPNVASAEDSRAVQAVIALHDRAIAIEIDEGGALALGNQGRVELWGNRRVTVSLGQHYQH